MAGSSSLGCCRGCSSPSCACDVKGKWSDSSLLGRRLSEDSSRHLLLQKWAGMWSSLSGNQRAAGAEETRPEEMAEADEEETERPLVFLCSGCRRPLGDSLSWVSSQEDTNCILLRSVSCNVSVDKEQKLSKRKNENGWAIPLNNFLNRSADSEQEQLRALEISYKAFLKPYIVQDALSVLAIYTDVHRRILISRETCFASVLKPLKGSSEKQIVSEDKELFNLESRVEIEKSLKQMEDVLKALQTKLWEVESKLSPSSCKS